MSRRDASNAKAFAQQKKHRRQWLTFLRMLRYGINNFSRNAWLTVAATAVMTITLLIIFMTFVAQNVLSETATDIGKRIDRSIYLKPETTAKQAAPIVSAIEKLDNVEDATFISSAQARDEFAKTSKANTSTLDALNEATNKIPATIRIRLVKVSDTASLIHFVDTDQTLKKYIDPVRKPTFVGERKNATDTIANWTQFAQKLGILASAIFVTVSGLIIFNTIRMAIFNRREEIQMMKLVGADKNFIRGPFVVEAIVYGFIAAIVATILGMLILYASTGKLNSYGVSMKTTVDMLSAYIGVVVLIMILLGSLIGTVSALFATRRYLKI